MFINEQLKHSLLISFECRGQEIFTLLFNFFEVSNSKSLKTAKSKAN